MNARSPAFDARGTPTLNIQHAILVETERTAGFQMTNGLRETLANAREHPASTPTRKVVGSAASAGRSAHRRR
jgi:hypothetical protein